MMISKTHQKKKRMGGVQLWEMTWSRRNFPFIHDALIHLLLKRAVSLCDSLMILRPQGRMIDADIRRGFEELAAGRRETLGEIPSHPGK